MKTKAADYIQMGLDSFNTGEGPRTYKRGGRRDPNRGEHDSNSYEDSAYNGVIHVPSGMEVPELAHKLRLEVERVERIVDPDGDALYISTRGNRTATSFEAMVKVDWLRLRELDDIDKLVKHILDNADECEEIRIDEPVGEDKPKEQKAQEDNDQSGLGAFMS